ncbi:MAG: MBOAT family protein [Rhodoblastus sp.]|nr:MBOAT family protein [Rhodoblastus sp.]
MLFNSFVFLVFFCVFMLGWPIARQTAPRRWIYIVVFSLFFYGWWDWRYVLLLVATGFVDFCAGLLIYRHRRIARPVLIFSIVVNLFVLGLFKYSFVVAQGLNASAAHFGLDLGLPVVQWILPVGISFYTFQSMSYTIDVYQGKCEPTHSFLHFLAAISMFPHLVAGPIMRASKLLPQLIEARVPDRVERFEGLRLITHGYFKKVVIADNLALTINDAFGGAASLHTGAEWWIIATMFAMQIYCDFSGYSDIARGLAKWMGYEFTLNFAHPYTSTSLREFWERWHISLSTWFRDYVYIPLGGSRRGELLGHRNLFITMVLSAIWHGPGLTYVMWGVIHAGFLSLERATGWPQRLSRLPLGAVAGWAIVVAQVWIAWIFFRATSIEQALGIVGRMLSPSSLSINFSTTALLFLAVGVVHEFYTWRLDKRSDTRTIPAWEAATLVLTLVACVFFRGPGNTFIYFQF